MTFGDYATAYISALITLGILDTLYIKLGGIERYKNNIGHLMSSSMKLAPAVPLYLIAIAGFVYFGIRPAIEQHSISLAVLNCAFLGFLLFTFYELTNLITLKKWPVVFAMSEIAWGLFASAILGAVSYLVTVSFF